MIGRITIAAAAAAIVSLGATTLEAQDKAIAQADALEAAADRIDRANASSAQLARATARDIALACRLASRFHVTAFASDRPIMAAARHDAVQQRLRALSWRALPAHTRWGGRGLVTFQPRGFGDFVTGIASGPDGRFVGLRGGWQHAPLTGGGADCLYERRTDGLLIVGCVHTWAS
ncbi:MAG: hypothetical protein V4537_10400 [Pseudomonadota bacterium]